MKNNNIGLRQRLLFVFLIILFDMFYFLVGRVNTKPFPLQLAIDNLIPFVSYFVIPYITWHPFIIASLMYFAFVDSTLFYRLCLSIYLVGFSSYIIFYFFPTIIEPLRPDLVKGDFFTNLVIFIYSKDTMYNCFPSIHVSYTVIIAFCFFANNSHVALKIGVGILGILIILSTMFIKQHYFLDVIGGIVLALFWYFAVKAGEKLFYKQQLLEK